MRVLGPNSLSLAVIAAVLLPFIGIAIGFSVGVAWNSGALTQWQRLPVPPAKLVRFVAGTTNVVFVEAVDGQVYSCDPAGSECWIKTHSPSSLASTDEACNQYPLHYAVSAPPGETIDTLQTQWCHFEAGEETDYALLEDGHVWMWKHWDANYLNLARSLGTATGGCCAGLFVGLTALVFIWRQNRRRAKSDNG